MPNVVCLHEVDDGILWKHTNYRTGRVAITRNRVLVLQTIITVSNYEYIFAFHFTQAAGIKYEVRATGILSTTPINIGDSVPYGNIVAPGVMAPYHQHLFSLRIDPMIDGQKNSFHVSESRPMPLTATSSTDFTSLNPFGVGYTCHEIILDKETFCDTDITRGKAFRVINESVLNNISGRPVGYEIIPQLSQMILCHPTSFHSRRSEFAEHAFWVTKYHDGELYAAGEHTLQSPGGDGLASRIKSRNESIRDEDIVVWHTFGTTHNPRVEDWPVMPEERMVVHLKPVDFFEGNPSIDVRQSTQAENRSKLVGEQECHC
jgi:primary-amine oxidase